jgi:hypothetical protein
MHTNRKVPEIFFCFIFFCFNPACFKPAAVGAPEYQR